MLVLWKDSLDILLNMVYNPAFTQSCKQCPEHFIPSHPCALFRISVKLSMFDAWPWTKTEIFSIISHFSTISTNFSAIFCPVCLFWHIWSFQHTQNHPPLCRNVMSWNSNVCFNGGASPNICGKGDRVSFSFKFVFSLCLTISCFWCMMLVMDFLQGLCILAPNSSSHSESTIRIGLRSITIIVEILSVIALALASVQCYGFEKPHKEICWYVLGKFSFGFGVL